MYIISPEFHRNLWLKFSGFKIAVPLVVLGFIAFIANAGHMESMHTLRDCGMWVYFIIVIIWGNYEAGGALQEEIRDKTWDLQRMSSITPAELAFGKLFGVTSYTWYFGLLSMLLFLVGCAESGMTPHELVRSGFCLVFSGVFGQAVAYLMSLSDLGPARVAGRVPRGKPAFLLGLIVSYYVFTKTVAWVATHNANDSIFDKSTSFEWFARDVGWENFVLASMMFFFGWTLTGIYRLTRAELMYRMTPSFWGVFVLSLGLYFAGVAAPETDGSVLPAISNFFMVALAASYLAMMGEARDVRKYGRLALCIARGDKTGAYHNTPRWVVSMVLAGLAWIAGVICFVIYGGTWSVPTLMTTTLLLALRDGCVLHSLYLRPADRQAPFQVLFYYFAAYLLLPAFHTTIADHVLHLPSIADIADVSGDLSPTLAWYYPTAIGNPLESILPLCAELLGAGLWLNLSLRRLKRKPA